MTTYCRCLFLSAALALTATATSDCQPPTPKDGKLSAKELQSTWEALGGKDPAKAYRAIWTFANAPKQSVPFLKERLKPVVVPKPGAIDRLIADLDSKRAAEQDRAEKELEKLGELAVLPLRRALFQARTPQLQGRIKRLLQGVEDLELSAEQLRALRALEALEYMRTAEARQLLEAFAKGAPGARSTEEAKAAVNRLDKLKAP